MNDFKNKRQSSRFKEKVKVSYRFLADPGKKGDASTLDLSTQGSRILINRDFPKGSIMELTIKIPDTRGHILVRAEVVWSKGVLYRGKKFFELGFRFLNIGLKERSQLYFKGLYRVSKEA